MADISVTVSPENAGPLFQSTNRNGEVPAQQPRPSQQFSATVTGDPVNAGVKWEVAQGAGQIDDRGIFYPPEYHGKSTVKATSVTDKTKSATATATYHCPARCSLHQAA
jgi:hypothetical protein